MINNVVDLLVCTLFGIEAATEITLAGLNQLSCVCSDKAIFLFLQCKATFLFLQCNIPKHGCNNSNQKVLCFLQCMNPFIVWHLAMCMLDME